MKLMHAIYAAVAVVLMTVSAHALEWSANATSCVPDAESIKFGRYASTAAKIAHSVNNVDLIQVVCKISEPLPSDGVWDLNVTYRDSNGTTGGAYVIARLFSLSRLSGVQTLVAVFNSNSSSAVGVTKGSIAFSHTFDFVASYYYVVLLLDRTQTNQVVEAYGVAIEQDF